MVVECFPPEVATTMIGTLLKRYTFKTAIVFKHISASNKKQKLPDECVGIMRP